VETLLYLYRIFSVQKYNFKEIFVMKHCRKWMTDFITCFMLARYVNFILSYLDGKINWNSLDAFV